MTPREINESRRARALAISDAANGVSSLPLQSPQPAPTGQAARAAVSTCEICGESKPYPLVPVASAFYFGT